MILPMVFAIITFANSSKQRIAEIFEEETDIKNPENPITRSTNGETVFNNVDFAYNKANKNVLSNMINKINIPRLDREFFIA